MDTSPGIKFGDLKKEERYKRLQRTLKLASVQQTELAKIASEKGYCTSPTWPSLSTINVDALDSSCANGLASLQISRVHSEVVSSSTNFHKQLPMHKGHLRRAPMATSSIKKFPGNNFDQDRIIMPPPSVTMFHNVKPAITNTESKLDAQEQQNRKRETNTNDHDSLTKISSDVSCSDFQENKSHSKGSTSHKVFSCWRVLINDKGQLIIKGTLECGKIARSKPVIQRFTNTKVQSSYKHIYILDGSIVDDRDELPDYVRGKFHNGFPDDWENVFQLWRNYIAEGSPKNFRWPTPITDSDDDLNSEITDFTYIKEKQSQRQKQDYSSKSITNNSSSLDYHSKTQSDGNQNLEKSKEETVDHKVSTGQNVSRKIDDSELAEMKDVSTCSGENNNASKNASKDSHSSNVNNSNSTLKNTSYLNEIIKEDKLRIILSNLGNENCPPQYLDKFIDLIDCLRYVLSYTFNRNNEANFKKQNSSPSKNQILECQKCNSTASFSETQDTNPDQNKNESTKPAEVQKNQTNCEYFQQTENTQSQENLIQSKPMNFNNEAANQSSDSDTYMGFPNVSLNRLIKSKVPRSERYRNRKNRSRDRQNANRNRPIEESMKNVKDKQHQLHENSSLSSTEDEYERKYQENKDERLNQKCSYGSNRAIENVKQYNIKKSSFSNAVKNDEYVKVKCSGSKLYSAPTKDTQKIVERKKPIIKSNEPVNLDLNMLSSKNHVPINSDVSITDEEISRNKKKISNRNSNNNNNNEYSEEKVNDELLKHPFLTYDSEDFSEEDIEMQIKSSSNKSNNFEKRSSEVGDRIKTETRRNSENLPINQENHSKIEKELVSTSTDMRKMPLNNKIVNNSESYGSKENPKILSSWTPCVMYDDELRKRCSLSFEGKLLNEAGHILDRKFVTDPIRYRHSAKLIETVKNEFFKLDGEFNTTKNVVPKELSKYCRTGCPLKIKEFCEEWKQLQPVLEKPGTNKLENLHNSSIDQFSIPTSSRGRKICPPLDYWNGERLVTKDNITIYKSGDYEEPVSATSIALSEQRPKKNFNTKESNARISKTSTKPSKAHDMVSSPIAKHKPLKKRIVQTLHFTSSSESEKEIPKKKSLRSSKVSTDMQLEQIQPQVSVEVLTESGYNAKMKKRQRVGNKKTSEENAQESNTRSKILTRKSVAGLAWTYEQEHHHDILSEDEVSIFMNTRR